MRASEFIIEALDSDAVNELDSFIMNNEELYRRRFMPIITNLKRKIAKKVYDHDKAQKLWMYLVDDAAREYVKEFGSQGQDVSDMFPKETRLQVAKVIADRELENIEHDGKSSDGRWIREGAEYIKREEGRPVDGDMGPKPPPPA